MVRDCRRNRLDLNTVPALGNVGGSFNFSYKHPSPRRLAFDWRGEDHQLAVLEAIIAERDQ